MKSFREYLIESTKENHYALKLAMEPTDKQMDAVESFLKKFDLLDISKPKKLEKDGIDFYNVPHNNIYQINVTAGMPISQYILMQQLRNVLNIPEEYIVVRSANEPIEVHAEDMEFKGPAYDPTKDSKLSSRARLSTDRFYDDAEQPLVTDVFGDDYNKRLMDYLASVADDRRTDHYEAPSPLFSWMDMDKAMAENTVESEDFNERFDTVKPVSKGKGKDAAPIEPRYLGRPGNFDDGASANVRLLKNDKGKHDAVSAPRARLKAEKAR